MKTSVMEVHDMLSVLSVDGVEQRIRKVPGVESVTVNFAAGSATVRYDETRLNIADIRSDVRQSGYEADEPGAAPTGDSHEGHAITSPPSEAADPAAPDAPGVLPPPAPAAAATPTGDEHHHKDSPEKSEPVQFFSNRKRSAKEV